MAIISRISNLVCLIQKILMMIIGYLSHFARQNSILDVWLVLSLTVKVLCKNFRCGQIRWATVEEQFSINRWQHQSRPVVLLQGISDGPVDIVSD